MFSQLRIALIDNFAIHTTPADAIFWFEVFSIMDVDNNGLINFEEFYRGILMMAFARQDKGVRLELYYRSADLDHSGSISRAELIHFIKRLMKVGGIPKRDKVRGWPLFFV